MAENEEEVKKEGEESGAGEEGEQEAGKGSKGKLIILIAVVVLLLGGVGGGLYFMGVFSGAKEPSEQASQDGQELVEEASEEEANKVVYYELGEFLVNLSSSGKQSSFLKMIVSLELPGEAEVLAVEQKMPLINDAFQVYLRELRVDDLQGSVGIVLLREQLLLRINKVMQPTKVNDILFKEILVQ